jgi:hypothetical protein
MSASLMIVNESESSRELDLSSILDSRYLSNGFSYTALIENTETLPED